MSKILWANEKKVIKEFWKEYQEVRKFHPNGDVAKKFYEKWGIKEPK